MTDIHTAQKCFIENLHLFSSPTRDPDRFNLYTGLVGLAKAMETMQASLDRLEKRMQRVEDNATRTAPPARSGRRIASGFKKGL